MRLRILLTALATAALAAVPAGQAAADDCTAYVWPEGTSLVVYVNCAGRYHLICAMGHPACSVDSGVEQ